MMFRIGKPESLLFLTPTKEEVRGCLHARMG